MTINKADADFLNSLCEDIHKENAAKGFWDAPKEIQDLAAAFSPADADEYSPSQKQFAAIKAVVDKFSQRNHGELLALITYEVSEALEADRKDLMDDKLPARKGLEVELADALIRILDMAGGLKLDLGGAMIEKLEFNRSREHKHGKKY